MLLFDDILFKENIVYNNKNKIFQEINSNDSLNNEFDEEIEEPVVIMDTLHSCFSHAIMNSVFPIFWVVQDLIQSNHINTNNIRIFIRSEDIIAFPKQNLPLINEHANTYNGVWKEIIEFLTNKPILFEHLITKNIVFKKCIFYPHQDKWQRTPWNCNEYYPDNIVPKQQIRFSDEIIYKKLDYFRSYVLSKHITTPPDIESNDLIIIDRKTNRTFDKALLNSLEESAKLNTNWNFKGVVILEDLTLSQQIEVFNKTKIYIFRHGSSLINLLWTQPKSIVFELVGGKEGVRTLPAVIERICKLTDSKQICLHYDNFHPIRDIFSRIS
jgi:hypothetical protein